MQFLPILIVFLFTGLFAQEQSDADKRKELLGTVKVSRVHSIDEVKGTYKSPRKAMFMSLALPGSGQIYVGSKQSRYIRGAFYLAEEAALISGLYYSSIYKYDKQVNKYQSFAKKHFDVMRYEEEMNGIYGSEYGEKFQGIYGLERENYCKAIFGSRIGSNDKCINFSDGLGFFNDNYKNVGGNFSSPSAYYGSIASESFVLGWDDAISNKDEIMTYYLGLADSLPEYKPLGSSANFKEYMSMRKKANDLADKQAFFIGALILNHIISAVDAALSAKAHNNSLYEEKVSFLDKIRLGSDFQMGDNFRAGAGLWYYF